MDIIFRLLNAQRLSKTQLNKLEVSRVHYKSMVVEMEGTLTYRKGCDIV